MTAAPALGAALALYATGCGNLARDVIVTKQGQTEADAAPVDAGAAPVPRTTDAGASMSSASQKSVDNDSRCARDGGCRNKIAESCNRYTCEQWCQYWCSNIASEECRAKRCRQTSSRQGLP